MSHTISSSKINVDFWKYKKDFDFFFPSLITWPFSVCFKRKTKIKTQPRNSNSGQDKSSRRSKQHQKFNLTNHMPGKSLVTHQDRVNYNVILIV